MTAENSKLLTAADFVVAFFFRNQKGQKVAKKNKKESFCCFCYSLPFLLPKKRT
jgi:hypothetical protein